MNKLYARGIAGQLFYNSTEIVAYALTYRPIPDELIYTKRIKYGKEKLEYIGFNDKERNEFITYWLPVLEKNKKSLVYFELTEERESYNKININPKPDTLLRVVIHINADSWISNTFENSFLGLLFAIV